MKDVVGYEGLYGVTIYGDIWSYRKQRFLSPCLTKRGYRMVILSKDGHQKHEYVHRLVAQAYIKNPDNLPQVNHKDEDKTNNNVENLEWCTGTYNVNYGTGKKRSVRKRSYKIRCIETGEEFESINQCYYKYGWRATSISEHLRGLRTDVNGLHFERLE